LEGSGESADDEFGIDGVGGDDLLLGRGADEAEVAGVEEIVVVGAAGYIVAEEEGLDDVSDAGFLEVFEEAVEVNGAALDEALDGVVDVVEGDGAAVVTLEGLLDDFAGDGVDEPRLAECLLVDMFDGIGLEHLPCFGGMLCVEGGNLIEGEVLEGHGFGDDVEGAGGAE
jgi:hypothetical protein